MTSLECTVYWASPDDARVGLWDVLSSAERERYERLRRSSDRKRSVVGAAVLRLAAGAILGMPPQDVPIDRSCAQCTEQHGKPVLPKGADLYCSVSHSGNRVAVAMCRNAVVGIDVESVESGDPRDVDRLILADEEREVWQALNEVARRLALYEYWTRKEAVLKATGDGLNTQNTRLVVSAPDASPAILSFAERPALVAGSSLAQLSPGEGYVACLAVLVPRLPVLIESSAADLLAVAG